MFGSREEKGSFFGHGCGRLIEKNESEIGKPLTAQCGNMRATLCVLPTAVTLVGCLSSSLCRTIDNTFITFRVNRRRRKMYCGHARLCVCVCVRGRTPTLLHGPGCNLIGGVVEAAP